VLLNVANERRKKNGYRRYRYIETVANETINFDRFFNKANRGKKGKVGEINSRQF
jgi:hypothetical protein